ncbi:MAG: thioredoxin [Betaproteobacteria bacterium HGW-Betaproteobacteria-22]|nr:MAG: thioredoxin [Betaproteobacteria bacterium HGW-Betaproteobacteria-22]
MCRLLCCVCVLILMQPTAVLAEVKGQFLFKDLSGKQHRLSDYRGQWVLVNYWATWCPPCLEEVPDFVNLHKLDKLVVLGVVVDYKDVQEVREYADDMQMNYPIVLGDDDVLAQLGSADVLPTTFIYNPQGELVKTKRGLITRQYIEGLTGLNK